MVWMSAALLMFTLPNKPDVERRIVANVPTAGAVPNVPLSVHPAVGAAGVKGDCCCSSDDLSTSDVPLLISLLSRCPTARGISWTARKSKTTKNAPPTETCHNAGSSSFIHFE
jgi:hypothetical protein